MPLLDGKEIDIFFVSKYINSNPLHWVSPSSFFLLKVFHYSYHITLITTIIHIIVPTQFRNVDRFAASLPVTSWLSDYNKFIGSFKIVSLTFLFEFYPSGSHHIKRNNQLQFWPLSSLLLDDHISTCNSWTYLDEIWY